MQNTSIEAYYEALPHIDRRQSEILSLFTWDTHLTNLEISKKLNLEINKVTPRTNELVKMGVLREKGKRKCTISGRTSIAWTLK